MQLLKLLVLCLTLGSLALCLELNETISTKLSNDATTTPIPKETIKAEEEGEDLTAVESETEHEKIENVAIVPTTSLPEVNSTNIEMEKEDNNEETPDEESEETEENVNEDDEENEEESEEEQQCTFNRFLSGLNISQYLPEDRESLKTEFQGFEAESPERIRNSPSVNFTVQRLKRLLNLANTITSRQDFRSGLTSFVQHNYDLFLELELDASCVTSLISIIAAIRRSELWAIKFVDSMAKPAPGLLSGVTSFLGDFDQCLSVSSPETANEEFKGQYCLLRPILPLPEIRRYSGQADEDLIKQTKLLNYLASYKLDAYLQSNPLLKFIEHMKSIDGRVLNFGICIPNLCSPAQLERSFNKLLYPIIGIPFEIHNASCWTRDRAQSYTTDLSQYGQFALMIVSTLAFLVISSTIYELYFSSILPHQLVMHEASREMVTPAVPNRLLLTFSAISNTNRLVNAKRLAPFDTLRFAIVVLLGLTNAFYVTPVTSGLKKMSRSAPYEMLYDWKYFFVRAPTLLNDGLLVICAALFVRSIFRHLSSPHDMFSYILFLLRRWLRLTAPLFGSIMFIYLLPVLGSGPLWNRLGEITQPACQTPSSLSSSLLYYSNWNFIKANYSGFEDSLVCNPETWFLSIIFQLNLFFFAIVIFIYQSPRSALRLVFVLILASLVLNVSPRLLHRNTRTFYELTRQQSLWSLRRNFYLYHQNILQYVGSFSIGLMLGYVIVIDESRQQLPLMANKIKGASSSSQRRAIIYTWVSLATIALCYLWVNQFFVLNGSPHEISVLLFFSFGRLAFSLAFAWICHVSISGKIKCISSALSSRSIQPVTRLSFSIFLVQGLVQYHRMFSIKDTYVMTFRSTIENYTIDLVISILLGYVLYLLFEAPSQCLNELFCGKTVHGGCLGSNLTDYIYSTPETSSGEASKKDTKSEDYNSCNLSSGSISSGTSCFSKTSGKGKPSHCPGQETELENGVISIRF